MKEENENYFVHWTKATLSKHFGSIKIFCRIWERLESNYRQFLEFTFLSLGEYQSFLIFPCCLKLKQVSKKLCTLRNTKFVD